MPCGAPCWSCSLEAGLCFGWLEATRFQQASLSQAARVGQGFFYSLVAVELSFLLLVAAGATAGAICLDKARGTLVHVLVTDLSNAEVILGKLAARLLPILGLLLTSVPVLCGAMFLGGISPEGLLGALLVQLGAGVLGCALALTMSVWGRKTHEVLMTVYLIWILCLLAIPLAYAANMVVGTGVPGWLDYLNPYSMAFLPCERPDESVLGEQIGYSQGCLGICPRRHRS